MARRLLRPWLMDSTHDGRRSGGEPLVPAHVERALAGDREAWNELFAGAREGLRLRIEARLGARLRERVEADDILQEGYLAAASRIVRRCAAVHGVLIRRSTMGR